MGWAEKTISHFIGWLMGISYWSCLDRPPSAVSWIPGNLFQLDCKFCKLPPKVWGPHVIFHMTFSAFGAVPALPARKTARCAPTQVLHCQADVALRDRSPLGGCLFVKPLSFFQITIPRAILQIQSSRCSSVGHASLRRVDGMWRNSRLWVQRWQPAWLLLITRGKAVPEC